MACEGAVVQLEGLSLDRDARGGHLEVNLVQQRKGSDSPSVYLGGRMRWRAVPALPQ
jgi:hypothetical protein